MGHGSSPEPEHQRVRNCGWVKNEDPVDLYPRGLLTILQFHYLCRMNFPLCSSLMACCSSACVFITIGPYHATGSSSGFPETSRNRMPSGPACTVTSSPRSNNTSERLSASTGGVVSA